MKYTAYKTYQISRVIFGTVQLGMPYGISNEAGVPDSEETSRMLDYALAAGINTFDTAREYGASEEILGRFTEKRNAVSLNMISKFKIAESHQRDLEKAWKEVSESVKKSLESLKIARLPVCLLHKGAEPMEKLMLVLPEILTRLKSEELIDIGGVSAYFPEDVDDLINENSIEAVQIPFNVFDQRLLHNQALNQLKQVGKLVFARSVFLQGLFFLDPATLTGNLRKAGPLLIKLQSLAEQAEMSVSQLAFSFVRDQPGISSIVVGAVNQAQIQENMVLANGPEIPEAVLSAICQAFAEVDEEVITPGLWRY